MEKFNVRVFFVDNNPEEVMALWEGSRKITSYEMAPFKPFVSVEQTIADIKSSRAPIVVLAHYLDGVTTGVDIIEALNDAEYPAMLISNTGGDSKQLFPDLKLHANRDSYELYCAIAGIKNGNRLLYLGHQANHQTFEQFIKIGDYVSALKALRRIKEHNYLEWYVDTVLDQNVFEDSPETVLKVLDYFIEQREDLCPQHGYWVHSVSQSYTQTLRISSE